MGSTSSRPPSPPLIAERDADAQCDSGDVLLMREGVLHTGLRVTIDRHVATDISRIQQGAFPTTRLTRLPPWTSCALLMRVEGDLCVLDVDVDGVRLVPFRDRIAQRSARHDTYVIRRLQHVRNETTAVFFQQLAAELSRSAPFRWSLAPSGSPSTVSPTPPTCSVPPPSLEPTRQLRDSLAGSTHLLPVLQRALELFRRSTIATLPSEPPAVSQSELETSSRLATAVVVAVYSFLGVASSDLSASLDLTPSSLCSTTDSASSRLQLTPPNALGLEMRLV